MQAGPDLNSDNFVCTPGYIDPLLANKGSHEKVLISGQSTKATPPLGLVGNITITIFFIKSSFFLSGQPLTHPPPPLSGLSR